MKRPAVCKAAQQLIAQYKRSETDENKLCTLGFVLQDMVEFEDGYLGDAEVEAAAKHIGNCAICQKWVDRQNPEAVKLRKRMAKYCCAHMFNSINDADAKIKFQFAYFRDEPCWCINGSWEFADFCPWCGKQLPANKGFE